MLIVVKVLLIDPRLKRRGGVPTAGGRVWEGRTPSRSRTGSWNRSSMVPKVVISLRRRLLTTSNTASKSELLSTLAVLT